MSKILVWDLELAESPTAPGKSWGGAIRGDCGMSCAAVYDSTTQRPYLYTGKQVDGLADHLESGDLVIGFNSIRFDLPIVEALTGRSLIIKEHLDLLREVEKVTKTKKGYGLGSLGERCLGRKKDGEAALAPDLFAQGRWPELISYLLSDVFLTRDLYTYILSHCKVISPEGVDVPIQLRGEVYELI